MSRILESFKEWKSTVNEQSEPSRVKLTNDINQKAVITPIDKTSFRVRTKWVNDIIDATGKLTPSGFNSILTEIRDYVDPSTGQASLINYYSGLKDLTRNLVVYNVIRDTDTAKDPNPKIRKQSFKFTIVSRELYPNIPANTLYVHQDEATKPSSGGQQTVNTGEVLTSSDTFGLDFSKGVIYITNPSDAKMIKLIDSLYFKLSADEMLVSIPAVNEFRKALASELKVSRLGDNAKTFISALNAAFNIVTRYGDLETGVTQQLLQKVKEVKSSAPGANTTGVALSQASDFNVDAFISNLTATSSNIKAPAGGFKKGSIVRDPEFMKFQQLLAQKFGKSLGSSKIYKNFAKFKVGGADGTYGPNTAALVGLLKAALTDPKWTGNMDKNIVDQAFIDRINQEKVAESYIALDGFSLISEGLDMTAVEKYEQPSGNVRSAERIGDNNAVESNSNSGKKYLLQDKDDFEYFVKGGVWHYKKSGGKLNVVTSPSSIKRLITLYPEAGGFYIQIKMDNGKYKRSDKHLYKLKDNVWYIQLNGTKSWQKLEDPAWMISTYKIAKGSDSTGEKVNFSKLDEEVIKLGNSIKTFVENPETFTAYKDWNDEEQDAWDEVLIPQWERVWKKQVGSLYKKVNTIDDDYVKKRYRKTLSSIKAMFTKDVGTTVPGYTSFYGKFLGETHYDTFTLKLYLGATAVVKPISINTDF
jgi:hypothetical protein